MCDLMEAACVKEVFDNSTYRAEECNYCYPSCRAVVLDYKHYFKGKDLSKAVFRYLSLCSSYVSHYF